MTFSMASRCSLGALIAILALQCPKPVQADTLFNVTLLPSGFTPVAVNDSGTVVGRATGPAGFVGEAYSNGVLSGISVVPTDINNSGAISGSFNYHPAVLTGGTVTYLTSPSLYGNATAINNSGQAVGYYGVGSVSHYFFYSNGVETDLVHPGATGGTSVYGLNDLGQTIVSDNSGPPSGGFFIYSNGTYTPLPWNPIPGLPTPQFINTLLLAPPEINDSGEVVGNYRTGPFENYAFADQNGNLTLLNQSSVESLSNNGQFTGSANCSGTAQLQCNNGTVAYLSSSNGSIENLNNAVNPSLGIYLEDAFDISDGGDYILASGAYVNSRKRRPTFC